MSAASYFIYYKVRSERLDELRRLVRALFAMVERETGVRGRWMRRRDEPATYMEVYEGVLETARFETLLGQEVARLGIVSCLAGDAGRRTEIFLPAQVESA